MAPHDRSHFDDTTLEHFERYCVEGDIALTDLAVARTTSRYKDVISRLRPVILELRAQSRSTTDRSFSAVSQQIDRSTTDFPIVESQPANPSTGYLPTTFPQHRPSFGAPFKRWIPHRAWAAASIICIAVLTVVIGRYQRADRDVNVPPTHSITNTVTYSAANGQRTAVKLPDGSRIILNSGSELIVPNDFGNGHRTLNLQGEAMFTVTHESHTPFIVMAGVTMTRVLGTTFVVRHYRTDTITSVAVREGKVAVQSVVVPALWQANVMSSGAVTLTEANEGRFTFASGALTLNDMSLPDAITELERWYNADIRLAHPSLTAHRVTGIFHAGSVADLAIVLELALDVRVKQVGRTLILYPQGS